MHRRLPFLSLVALLLLSTGARADRRYFLQSSTGYLAPAGNLEVETTSLAASGQGDSSSTSWLNRFELEYGITDRLTGAMYLNFEQGPGQATTFDGPSLELICQLARPGRLPIDPAAYCEFRANGSDWEIEPKLLLTRRVYRLVGVVNLIGEYERHVAGPERGSLERAFRVSAGVSRELGAHVAIGLESLFTRDVVDGPDPSSWLLGPTVNLQATRAQLAIGWHPQISGNPATRGHRNLADFPRSEFGVILGVEL